MNISLLKLKNGNDYPPKTLYEIIISVQFHLGFAWKLLNQEVFKEVKFSLDNVMKLHTLQGLGMEVKQADVINSTHEEDLWSVGLLGGHDPEVLLNTIVYIIGKGCALQAGKAHHV